MKRNTTEMPRNHGWEFCWKSWHQLLPLFASTQPSTPQVFPSLQPMYVNCAGHPAFSYYGDNENKVKTLCLYFNIASINKKKCCFTWIDSFPLGFKIRGRLKSHTKALSCPGCVLHIFVDCLFVFWDFCPASLNLETILIMEGKQDQKTFI